MPDGLYLVRFGEIGIKSPPVRRRFERLLADNIARGLKARGAAGKVTQTWGRLFVRAPDDVARATLTRTFGVVSFSPVQEAPGDLDALAAFVAREAAVIPPRSTFAVRARRTGKQAFTSNDVARALGTSILDQHRERGLTVDLEEPGAEVIVEVRDDKAWVAFESVPGPGGLPVGSEGHVSAWVAEPRDALAAWSAMKRGCRVDVLGPRGSEALARALAAWDPALELVEVDASADDRALVLALLEAHAARRKGVAVVVGDRFLDALALAALDRTIALPVFRPILALESPMLADIAARLGLRLDLEEERALPAAQPKDAAEVRARAAELLEGTERRRLEL